MEGFFKIYRELFEKPIWLNSTPEQKVILIALLGMANHKDNEWEWMGVKYKTAPGQFVTSLNKIASTCGKGITIQNVRTALNRFEKFGFLAQESSKSNTLINIVNWAIYQAESKTPNKETNKELTKNQQRPNKDLTTNKNERMKECKNILPPIVPQKNESESEVQFADFVSMTNEEYSSLVTKLGEHGAKRCIEILDNYKGANGKRYKSDYRAILNWVISRYEEEQNKKGVISKKVTTMTEAEMEALDREWEEQQRLRGNGQ